MEYYACQYVPKNVVIAVAGNVTHDEVVTLSMRRWRPAPGEPDALAPR